MIDKISGKVSYAVLSFGGLLGIGDDHYPLPWQALKYDANLGATSPASPTTSSAAPPNTPTRGVGIGATRRPHAP
jgi:hypothetical protein